MHDYRTIKIANLLSYYYQNHVIKYCDKVYERSGKHLFGTIKNSCGVLNKLKARGFRESSLSTYDFLPLPYILPCPTILMRSEIIIYGLVRKCVKLSPFSYTIFILDSALNHIDKV